jgi:hypothetical protein
VDYSGEEVGLEAWLPVDYSGEEVGFEAWRWWKVGLEWYLPVAASPVCLCHLRAIGDAKLIFAD